jgi:heterodisulfide reductase subunit C
MKLRMLRNVAASFRCDLREGESGDVDTELAETLIKRGLAVPVSDEAQPKAETLKAVESPATVKAVEATPSITNDKKTK